MNRMGQPHGDDLGRMKPFGNETSSWALSSANSCGAILYGRLEIGVVPGIRSTMNSTHLSGGIPVALQERHPGSHEPPEYLRDQEGEVHSKNALGFLFWLRCNGRSCLKGGSVSLICLCNQGRHSSLIANPCQGLHRCLKI